VDSGPVGRARHSAGVHVNTDPCAH
jgi:hypothetical protein